MSGAGNKRPGGPGNGGGSSLGDMRSPPRKRTSWRNFEANMPFAYTSSKDLRVFGLKAHIPLPTPCRSVNNYGDLEFIDEGAYGCVFRAREVATGLIYALKEVKLAEDSEGFPITTLREIGLLLSLRHDNIVHVKEVVIGRPSKGVSDPFPGGVFIVMEYAENDMRSILEVMRNPYSQSEIKSLLLQLLRGVDYLHSRCIVHRDIKPSNLLVNRRGVLKICDFGLARKFGDEADRLSPGMTTLWYRSPEILLGAANYTSAVDMWSVGCIFFELAHGSSLFKSRSELEQMMAIINVLGTPTEEIWPDVKYLPNTNRLNLAGPPNSLLPNLLQTSSSNGGTPLSKLGMELLTSMLTYDPSKRVTAAEALQHPYFTEAPRAKRRDWVQSFPSRS